MGMDEVAPQAVVFPGEPESPLMASLPDDEEAGAPDWPAQRRRLAWAHVAALLLLVAGAGAAVAAHQGASWAPAAALHGVEDQAAAVIAKMGQLGDGEPLVSDDAPEVSEESMPQNVRAAAMAQVGAFRRTVPRHAVEDVPSPASAVHEMVPGPVKQINGEDAPSPASAVHDAPSPASAIAELVPKPVELKVKDTSERGVVPTPGKKVAVSSLNDMGNSIRLLSWKFGPEKDRNGKVILDDYGNPKYLDYSTFGAGIYAGLSSIGMVVQLIGGGDVDGQPRSLATTPMTGRPEGPLDGRTRVVGCEEEKVGACVLAAAKAFVPLSGMINPLVGLGVGTLLSLFSVSSSSKAKAMQELYEKLMQEVQSVIDDALVQQNLNNAYVTMASLLLTWSENPWYITRTPESDKAKLAYYDWYINRTDSFDEKMRFMFSEDCLDVDLEPRFPPTEVCKGFSANGVLLQQMHFAQAHVATYLAAAQVAPNVLTALQHVSTSARKARQYARLLAASYTNWMDYPTEFRCSYDEPSGWGRASPRAVGGWIDECVDCTATLTDAAQQPYRYIGKSVMDVFGCSPDCFGKKSQTQPTNICASSLQAPTGAAACPEACRNTQFEQTTKDWKTNATWELSPLVRAWQMQFTSAETANDKACDCPAPEYVILESNASACQLACRADLACQSFQWTPDGDVQAGHLVLNYSSPVTGTCSLFSCGWYLHKGAACETSDSCPSGTTCRVGNKRCLSDADCDPTATDCSSIPRTDTVDNGGFCSNSDQCSGLADFCFVGDNRCMSQADCNLANSVDGTSRDCTPLPKTLKWNFTKIDRQFCVGETLSHKFDGVTGLDACKANCGNSCNAFALGETGCVVYESCSASVTWRSVNNEGEAEAVYMKDISTSFTKRSAGSSCTFVQYNEF